MTAAPLPPGMGRALFDRLVRALLGLAIVVSLLLLAHIMLHWRIALPSFDVVDYHAFLARAIEGEIDFAALWERHNRVHLIAFPKLLWVLDLWLVDGAGWLVSAVSAGAILATLLLLVRACRNTPGLLQEEARLFAGLATLLLCSPLMAESLLSPVNVQWSCLALGVVLFAQGWQALCLQRRWVALGPVGAGALLAWLNAAPLWVLLLVAGLATWLCTRPDKARLRRQASIVVLAAALAVVLWETLAWFTGRPLLLGLLYGQLVDPAQVAQVEPFLREEAGRPLHWLLERLVFLGQFLLWPVDHDGAPVTLLATCGVGVWVALLWSIARWRADQLAWVLLCLFALVMGLAAAVLRFVPLYNFRHANVGVLLALPWLLLVYQSCSWVHRTRVLQVAILVYLPVFLHAMWVEAGSWAWEGSNQIREQQIGAAVGVQDPARFAYVWKHDEAHVARVEADRAVFREHGKGIYASEGYRTMVGMQPLPAVEVACDYRALDVRQHAPDPQAFQLRGQTRTATGEPMTRVLFRDASGRGIGWAWRQLPSARLVEQLAGSDHWGGHLRLVAASTAPQAVDIVAFDDGRRCQPARIMLPPVAQAIP